MSNISYSWPVQLVGNGESLKTVVDKYCKTNTSQKYLLNRIADSPFVYDGTTIISGSLTLDYSRGYWDKHPLYTLISDNIVYTGSLDISKWQVDNIVRYAQKSDLTERTAITLTPVNSYSFNSSFTYGYKRNGLIEIQFQLKSAFDRSKGQILALPSGCEAEKQVWFPVYSTDGGNIIARGNLLNGISINGPAGIDGMANLYGRVSYMPKS